MRWNRVHGVSQCQVCEPSLLPLPRPFSLLPSPFFVSSPPFISSQFFISSSSPSLPILLGYLVLVCYLQSHISHLQSHISHLQSHISHLHISSPKYHALLCEPTITSALTILTGITSPSPFHLISPTSITLAPNLHHHHHLHHPNLPSPPSSPSHLITITTSITLSPSPSPFPSPYHHHHLHHPITITTSITLSPNLPSPL